jgi:hypothetical protein
MVEQGTFEASLDFASCCMERVALSGTSGAGCISGKELEFVGTSDKGEEFHGETFYGTRWRVLL